MYVYILEAEHKTVPGRILQVYATRTLAIEARRKLKREFGRDLEWWEINAHEIKHTLEG